MSHNPHNIGRSFLVLGFVMLIIACITAAYLYSSFGLTQFERFVYGSIGVIFAALGALLLPAAAVLWKPLPLLSFVVFVLWLGALFPVGTQTHLGFMSLSHSHLQNVKNVESFSTEFATQEIAAANRQVEKYQQFASLNLSSLESKKQSLQADLKALQVRLSACPVNHYKKCIDPLNVDIKSLSSEIDAIDVNLSGATNYEAALQAKKQALESKKTALVNGDSSTVHPLFLTQSAVLGGDAKILQAYFLAFSAVIFEVFTALTFIIAFSILGSSATLASTEKAIGGSATLASTEKAIGNSATLASTEKAIGNSATLASTEKAIGNSATLASTEKAIGSSATKQCLHCGVSFKPNSSNQKFCTPQCRSLSHGKTVGY